MRLLVANRAEIAVRIMSTAAVLGTETVAVYPDDDAACAHVARASAAVRLPGAGPAAYLDAGAIVGAATASGCDTLHPGYGFLAENSDLARRCAAAGIRFAGPAPEVLDLFGDKTAARARAATLGIPLARATDGPASPEEARTFLDSLGPGAAVMVKAVAGGGGRGLRPVAGPAGLDRGLAAQRLGSGRRLRRPRGVRGGTADRSPACRGTADRGRHPGGRARRP